MNSQLNSHALEILWYGKITLQQGVAPLHSLFLYSGTSLICMRAGINSIEGLVVFCCNKSFLSWKKLITRSPTLAIKDKFQYTCIAIICILL